MGLFDSWRRKKQTQPKPQAKAREMKRSESEVTQIQAPRLESLESGTQGQIVGLVADYERLYKRREELQEERSALTAQLDSGELSATKFRKELMPRIQEASEVSEQLKVVSAKLTALGYRGVLH